MKGGIEMCAATFLAVMRVIIAVLIGAITCDYFPDASTTLRDFSYLITTVLLPCLTVANTAQSVSAEVLIRCSILLLFALMLAAVGVASAIVMVRVLYRVKPDRTGIPAELRGHVRYVLLYHRAPQPSSPSSPETAREGGSSSSSGGGGGRSSPQKKNKKKDSERGPPYVGVVLSEKLRGMGVTGKEVVPLLDVPHIDVENFPKLYWGSWVGCSIQNTVTLPLSLFQSLTLSFDWIDLSAGSAYIFVFSIFATVYVWGAGSYFVDKAKRGNVKYQRIREILEQHKARCGTCDASTQTEVKAIVEAAASMTSSHNAQKRHPPRHHYPSREEAAAAKEMEGTAAPHTNNVSAAAAVAASTVAVVLCDDESDVATRSVGVSAGVQADVEPGALLVGGGGDAAHSHFQRTPTPASVEQFPYDWEATGTVRALYECEVREARGGGLTLRKVAHSTKAMCLRLLQNLPFSSLFVAIFIGVIPPLRGLFFDGGFLAPLMETVDVVGRGSIPASLLLLGANLMGSTSAATATQRKHSSMCDAEQNTSAAPSAHDSGIDEENGGDARSNSSGHASSTDFDPHASFSLHSAIQQGGATTTRAAATDVAAGRHRREEAEARDARRQEADEEEGAAATSEKGAGGGWIDCVRRALSMIGVRRSFVWGIIAMRLVLIPAMGFTVLLSLLKAMPFLFGGSGSLDRTLLLVLFIECAAPTAINSALLFNQRDFMTYEWSKMLFFQYVLCALSMVMWASLGLVIAQSV